MSDNQMSAVNSKSTNNSPGEKYDVQRNWLIVNKKTLSNLVDILVVEGYNNVNNELSTQEICEDAHETFSDEENESDSEIEFLADFPIYSKIKSNEVIDESNHDENSPVINNLTQKRSENLYLKLPFPSQSNSSDMQDVSEYNAQSVIDNMQDNKYKCQSRNTHRWVALSQSIVTDIVNTACKSLDKPCHVKCNREHTTKSKHKSKHTVGQYCEGYKRKHSNRKRICEDKSDEVVNQKLKKDSMKLDMINKEKQTSREHVVVESKDNVNKIPTSESTLLSIISNYADQPLINKDVCENTKHNTAPSDTLLNDDDIHNMGKNRSSKESSELNNRLHLIKNKENDVELAWVAVDKDEVNSIINTLMSEMITPEILNNEQVQSMLPNNSISSNVINCPERGETNISNDSSLKNIDIFNSKGFKWKSNLLRRMEQIHSLHIK